MTIRDSIRSVNSTVSERQTAISRRAFLANAPLAALAFQTRGLFASAAVTSVVARTSSGSLRGDSANGVHVFRGVPFAQPPTGPLRFRPPVKTQPWSGLRDATKFGPSPMQWNESAAPGEAPLVHSEDCLYLNVWAPAGKGPYPVFVWIHGGGFVSGHASLPIFDGSEFAQEGIVCVTVGYRLGVFGFLDLGPLLGPSYSASANNALRDLIAALEWVQQNISAVGGDPSRVTVGGESAGAKLTGILMGIPSAQPLFHQMISESGGAERVWALEDSAAVANGFGEQWQKQTTKDSRDLLNSPAASLIEVQHSFLSDWPQHFPLRGEIDGHLVPQLPVKSIADGSTRGKRLLIGTNRDESAMFIGAHPHSDAAAKDLGNLTLAKFNAVFRRYQEQFPDMKDFLLRIRAVTAEEYWIPTIRLADAHLQGGGTAWMYRLDFSEDSGRLEGLAYHSLDVGLVWEHPHLDPTNAAAEAVLAKQVHQAWSAFIRGEAPAAPGLPIWPQYSRTSRPTMVLNNQSQIDQRPEEAELRLWEGVL